MRSISHPVVGILLLGSKLVFFFFQKKTPTFAALEKTKMQIFQCCVSSVVPWIFIGAFWLLCWGGCRRSSRGSAGGSGGAGAGVKRDLDLSECLWSSIFLSLHCLWAKGTSLGKQSTEWILGFVFQKPDMRHSRGSIDREDGALQGPVSVGDLFLSQLFLQFPARTCCTLAWGGRWFKGFAKCFHCYYMVVQLSKRLSFCGNCSRSKVVHAAVWGIWGLLVLVLFFPLEAVLETNITMFPQIHYSNFQVLMCCRIGPFI